MPVTIKEIETRKPLAKAAVAAAAVFALVAGFYAVKWQIGDMLGDLTSPTDEGAISIAQTAKKLAPSDPRSSWLLGAIYRSQFTAEGNAASVAQMANAVRSSPFNYRWWSDLGRSREQAGDFANAELAFKRSVELAPEYTLPSWQLGNFYLRRSRIDDAVEPLKKAAEHSELYRGQVFSIAWSYFDKDSAMVERFANGEPDVRAGLTAFFGNVNRPGDAIRVWNSLGDDEQSRYRKIAENAARTLFLQRSFSGAMEFSRQAGLDKYALVETFTNGDFESGLKEKDQHIFDWTIQRPDNKVEIGIDSNVAHGGKRSLRVNYRTVVKPVYAVFDQMVAVRPGSQQRIEFWLRTENLRSGSMPTIEVLSGGDNRIIAVTQPFPIGSNDWRQISVDVDVPDNTDGIRIRTSREPCGPQCPISGIFWVDDFTITEMGQNK